MNSNHNNLSPIDQLINEINRLIELTSREYETQKKRLNFLFQQLEKARNLVTYRTNPQLLKAFLTLMSFWYKSDLDCEQMTERMVKEVEIVKKKLEPEPPSILAEVSYEELENELARRKQIIEQKLKLYNI